MPRPHLLFVDAGKAQSFRDVMREGALQRVKFPDLIETAAEQQVAIEILETSGSCTIEMFNLEIFEKRYPDRKGKTTFGEALRLRLQEPTKDDRQIDILHFCGPGITPKNEETRLVLPSPVQNTVEMLGIEQLAGWLPASVGLVFLAACQSASVGTAKHLHGARQCNVISFRWEVRADRMPAFVREFYRAHLAGGLPTAVAYHKACAASANAEDTVWTSAMAMTAD